MEVKNTIWFDSCKVNIDVKVTPVLRYRIVHFVASVNLMTMRFNSEVFSNGHQLDY